MSLILGISTHSGPIHLVDRVSGEHTTIAVTSVQGNQCKLAISASDNVEIDRDVIYQKKQEGKGNVN